MRRHSKTLPLLKWFATTLSGLLFLILVLPGLGCEWFAEPNRTCQIVLELGGIGISSGPRQPYDTQGFQNYNRVEPIGWFRFSRFQFKNQYSWRVDIPIWLFLPPIAGATAFLWWRDRRIPPGHCQHCGYNLQGNISGVCPECGSPK